jgi:hypothetical protein
VSKIKAQPVAACQLQHSILQEIIKGANTCVLILPQEENTVVVCILVSMLRFILIAFARQPSQRSTEKTL